MFVALCVAERDSVGPAAERAAAAVSAALPVFLRSAPVGRASAQPHRQLLSVPGQPRHPRAGAQRIHPGRLYRGE